MTQGCLCLRCLVTKTSRKRDNQGQWCQVGGTWFDGLLNNTGGYLFIKCCTSEVPGMGGTWGVFSCFNSTWVALEPKLYMREVQWKDNADDAYACSQWRCQSPKSPTETSTPPSLNSHTFTHSVSASATQRLLPTMKQGLKWVAAHYIECPDQLSEGQNLLNTGAPWCVYCIMDTNGQQTQIFGLRHNY